MNLLYRLKSFIDIANCRTENHLTHLTYYDCKQIRNLEDRSYNPTFVLVKCSKGKKEIMKKVYFGKKGDRTYNYTTYLPIGCKEGVSTKNYTVKDLKDNYKNSITLKNISENGKMNGKHVYK